MALTAFCFNCVLSMLLLRGRFVPTGPLSPSQAALSVALKGILSLFALGWGFCFLTSAKAAAQALMKEDLLPLVYFMFWLPITLLVSFLVFRLIQRVGARALAELAQEVKTRAVPPAASDSWSEAWCGREDTARKLQVGATPSLPPSGVATWSGKHPPSCRGKAFWAFLLLGEPSYREMLAVFQRNKREDMKQGNLRAGQERPPPK
jgi:hypothetical protein